MGEVIHWYLIQFKPNSHRLAEHNLQRQGFGTFLPMQQVTRRKASRFVSVLKPLFPGYMFVSVDTFAEPLRIIDNTIGVTRLVRFEGKPKPLPRQIVIGLMQRCDSSGVLLPTKNLSTGDNVEMLTGPFARFIATVHEITSEKRIWVIMELMGRRTRIEFSTDHVQLSK